MAPRYSRSLVAAFPCVIYPAESYHQNYLTLHPNNPYIVYNDLPKLDELRRLFADLYRAEPALVKTASLTN